MSAAAPAPFQSASLYVGDLHADIAESVLFDLFSRVGPVVSIRVCRDSITRKSLGYAYINFQNVQDAERALDTMNFTEINGKPCRIMWSQRDPSLRKTGSGNIYVSNLAPSVDNKGLYDTFSVFGNILSCKVVTDEQGVSKGYGYVHFETGEAATDAINKFDGTLIDDMEVHVSHFLKRGERAVVANWTNIYIKQFPLTWDESRIRDIFSVYGTVQNVAVTVDETGKSKGFGFVNMSDHESASKAVAELHGKVFDEEGTPFTIYVGKAQKKTERARELKSRRDLVNTERLTKNQGLNLYVKNISDTISDEAFREAFVSYGTITSSKIMRDEAKVSRGFGFVCFMNPDEAAKAVQEMNGKVMGGKPLVVTFYQRKEIRRVQLAASYAPSRFQQGPLPGPMGNMGMPFMNMYMGQGYQGQGGPGGPGAMGPGGMGPQGGRPYPYGGPGGPGMPRGAPRGFRGPQGPPQGPGQGFYGQGMQMPYMPMGGQGQLRPRGPGQGFPMPSMPTYPPQAPQGGQGGQPRRPMPNTMPMPMGGPRGMMPMPQGMGQGPMGGMGMMPMGQGPMGMMPMGAPRGMGPGYMGPGMGPGPGMQGAPVKFTSQARNANPPAQMAMMPSAHGAPAKMDFSEALLATTDPIAQKNMIGERLYPLIYNHAPEQAGKITGMLLEMDNGELLNLIESPDALLSKIDEALTVLRNHKAQETA
jgi:polyadenylate-binding protein